MEVRSATRRRRGNSPGHAGEGDYFDEDLGSASPPLSRAGVGRGPTAAMEAGMGRQPAARATSARASARPATASARGSARARAPVTGVYGAIQRPAERPKPAWEAAAGPSSPRQRRLTRKTAGNLDKESMVDRMIDLQRQINTLEVCACVCVYSMVDRMINVQRHISAVEVCVCVCPCIAMMDLQRQISTLDVCPCMCGVSVCMHLHIDTCACIHAYIDVSACLHVCVQICIHVNTHIHSYMHTHTCFVCLCVYVCVFVYSTMRIIIDIRHMHVSRTRPTCVYVCAFPCVV